MGEAATTDSTPDLSGLRILGFCDHFTEVQGGGAEIVAREVYRYLQSRGAEIMVVSVVSGGESGQATVHGVPTTSVRGRDLSRVFNAQVMLSGRVTSVGRKAVTSFRPDVLHASSIHFRSAVSATRIARSVGLPLVTTAHVGSIQALPLPTRIAANIYEGTAGRFILRASDRVIAVSKNVADHVATRRVPRDKVTVVNNGVDHKRFQPHQAPEGRMNILFVGRLINNKGPLEALQAFARLDESSATLTFAGNGPMRERLAREAARLGVGQAVIFLDRVDDVAGILSSSDILIRPSLTEGQSLALLEAMAAGVCVVASDIPANAELIEHGVTGLLARQGDIEDLADKLTGVLRDKQLRDRLADAGHQRSLAFSWERCGAGTGAVLAATASKSKAEA